METEKELIQAAQPVLAPSTASEQTQSKVSAQEDHKSIAEQQGNTEQKEHSSSMTDTVVQDTDMSPEVQVNSDTVQESEHASQQPADSVAELEPAETVETKVEQGENPLPDLNMPEQQHVIEEDQQNSSAPLQSPDPISETDAKQASEAAQDKEMNPEAEQITQVADSSASLAQPDQEHVVEETGQEKPVKDKAQTTKKAPKQKQPAKEKAQKKKPDPKKTEVVAEMENEAEKSSAAEVTPKKTITQDEILLAALKLFAEKGYYNTSLTDISRQVGASTNSKIYQHFKTKQAIASTLYGNILDSLSCSIDDIRRRNQKPSEQLHEIVDLMFSLTDEAPEVMHFLLIMNVQEFLPDETPLHQTAPYIKINKILSMGIKNKEIRSADAQQAFTYFFGVINHTLALVLSGVLEKKAEAYLSNAWVTAWNSIAKK